MEATFRLARLVPFPPVYASVTVRVVPADGDEVEVGDEAFAWRLEAYGPHACYGAPYDADLIAEAEEGAHYALARLPAGVGPVRVQVVDVRERPVDTGPGQVKFAAAHAVWRALGHEPADPPTVTAGGEVVFP
ncbi:hypothetical protein HDA32_002492 [Spinactinospora alkalitolerans]|uniref:Uncharacterized protein n=1 Tax=Spinactinospora alkalitolerans TaxID=687207 RepID=A0A852TWW4_9ACTN|nr:hypothetical protein [Spinactinospora alkalitolerans]NYE47372.1 hypothetical protein [Spinactinospora alkalitolerans]